MDGLQEAKTMQESRYLFAHFVDRGGRKQLKLLILF